MVGGDVVQRLVWRASVKHRWSRHADVPCWCGGWHSLREMWRLNREARHAG